MEGFVVLIVLYAWFSIIRRVIRSQQAQKQGQKQTPSTPRRAKPAGSSPAARKPAAPQPGRAAARPVMTPRTSPEYQPMQLHMNDILRQEAELDNRRVPNAYGGSLGGESTEGRASAEGEDACDPSLGHGASGAQSSMDRIYGEAGDAPLAWNSQGLLQGVIMSEILKRPAERKWGRI